MTHGKEEADQRDDPAACQAPFVMMLMMLVMMMLRMMMRIIIIIIMLPAHTSPLVVTFRS